ncbi:MAG: hypothetical protein K8I30_18540, partial [Anaerolineae bacterium]|nr:hypothetical protein [Anaerolineae bacterium]
LQRARAFLFRARQVEKQATERLSSLMEAKERGRQRTSEMSGSVSTVSALKSSRERTRAESPSVPVIPMSKSGSETTYAPSQPKASPEAGNIAGQLLKRRKGREEDEA